MSETNNDVHETASIIGHDKACARGFEGNLVTVDLVDRLCCLERVMPCAHTLF